MTKQQNEEGSKKRQRKTMWTRSEKIKMLEYLVTFQHIFEAKKHKHVYQQMADFMGTEKSWKSCRYYLINLKTNLRTYDNLIRFMAS